MSAAQSRPRAGRLTAQVREEIARRIARRDLAPGAQLPTERDLSVEFGVSRVTVRRALAELTADGTVFAVQGRGTFVAGERVSEPANALLSFRDMVANAGVSAGSQPLRAETRAATVREAETFGIAPGAALFELERLRTLDGLPVAVDHNLLPLALDPDLAGLDWASASLYERLTAAGHPPADADYALEAQPASTRFAGLLDTLPGAPLLVAESRAHDPSGRLVVVGVISYRGDRYRFHGTQLSGRSGAR